MVDLGLRAGPACEEAGAGQTGGHEEAGVGAEEVAVAEEVAGAGAGRSEEHTSELQSP